MQGVNGGGKSELLSSVGGGGRDLFRVALDVLGTLESRLARFSPEPALDKALSFNDVGRNSLQLEDVEVGSSPTSKDS